MKKVLSSTKGVKTFLFRVLLEAGIHSTGSLPDPPALLQPRCQAPVARQLASRVKPVHIAHRSQNGHGRDHAEARQLYEIGHIVCPGVLVAPLGYLFPSPANLLLDVGPVLHLQFQFGQALVLLPGSGLLVEPFAPFMLQVMAVRHTVHAVHNLGMRFH